MALVSFVIARRFESTHASKNLQTFMQSSLYKRHNGANLTHLDPKRNIIRLFHFPSRPPSNRLTSVLRLPHLCVFPGESLFVRCVRDFPRPAVAGVNSLGVLHVKGSLGVALVEPRPLAIDCSALGAEKRKDSGSGLLTVRLPPSAEEERGSITHHGEQHIGARTHTHTRTLNAVGKLLLPPPPPPPRSPSHSHLHSEERVSPRAF